MNLNDLKRLLRPIQNKIFLLLGRAILTAINNSEGTQKIQIVALQGETITDAERMQEYGLETYPLTEAEATMIFLNGNRDHGLAICIHDRRYRPKDLVEGEVALYTYEDTTTPFRIQMKRNRIHFRRSDKEDIDIDTSKTEDIGTSKTVTAPSETHVNSTEHIINSPEVSLGGAAFGGLRKLIDERVIALINAHVHSGVTAGGVNTGAPTTTLTEANCATTKVKGI